MTDRIVKKTKLNTLETPADKESTKKSVEPKSKIVKKPSTSAETKKVINQVETVELAKAGKRSQKAQDLVIAKQTKETKKAQAATRPLVKPATRAIKARPKVDRAGKKYKLVAKLVDKTKAYSLAEAVELATKTSITKFDATVELHINLAVDPKQADQNIRDTISLPAGTGKIIRIAAFCEASDIQAAKQAGATIAGNDEVLELLDKQQIDFDVLITSSKLMPQLSKYARLLGPRGLMPSPKSGTITSNIPLAIEQAKAGKVEYRVDQAGIVHLGIGKVSFGSDKLLQNAKAVMTSIKNAKPSSIKSNYITNITISTTMGPGIKVETSVHS